MPPITRIEIENLRAFSVAELGDLMQVHVLIGPNNVGKSTIFEAILRTARERIPDVSPIRSELQRLLRHRGEGDAAGPHSFFRDAHSFRCVLWWGNHWLALSVVRSPGGASVSVRDSNFDLRQGPPTITQIGSIACLRPPELLGLRVEQELWSRVLSNRKDRKLVEALSLVFNEPVEQVQLLPSGELYLLYPEHSVPLEGASDGMRVVLRILLVLMMVEGSTLCIDEPELFLDRLSLELFAKVLCRMAKSQGTQLIISTHRLHALRAFGAACLELDLPFAWHHLERGRDGKLHAQRFDQESLADFERSGRTPNFFGRYA
ncbi:MAG: AAA family ATPase [Deltaproteobacteria bacterium]|nr:AAA family ATPase [Deltaproteobacteria bacterium]